MQQFYDRIVKIYHRKIKECFIVYKYTEIEKNQYAKNLLINIKINKDYPVIHEQI
jgi:hypothetical protein